MMKEVVRDPDTVHTGPPPFVGWWNAFREEPSRDKWRFWDGVGWSLTVRPDSNPENVARWSSYRMGLHFGENVRWTWYYPENARVPRLPVYCVYLDEDGELIDDFSGIYDRIQK